MRHKSQFTAICCLVIATLCSVKVDAEEQAPQPAEFIYATLYSAQVPLARGASLEELEAIAREKGSVEILTFSADGGQSEEISRELVGFGEPGFGYPYFSVQTQELLAEYTAARRVNSGAGDVTKKSTIKYGEHDVELAVTVPASVDSPLKVSYSVEHKGSIDVTMYLTKPIPDDESRVAPRLVRTRGLDGPTDIIQVFEYSMKKPTFDVSSSAWKGESRSGQLTHSNLADSMDEDRTQTPPVPQSLERVQRWALSGPSDGVDFGEKSIGYSWEYDTKWVPGGGEERGDFPVQIRARAALDLQLATADVQGTFVLEDQMLCVGAGDGFIKLGPIGAEVSAKASICVDPPDWIWPDPICPEPFDILDILDLPNIDFEIENRKDFSSFLLGSCATATDSIYELELFGMDILDPLCLALGVPTLVCDALGLVANARASLDGNLNADLTMCGESILVSDGSLFTYEGQCKPVDACGDYHESAIYNETLEMALRPQLCPAIEFKLLNCFPFPMKFCWKVSRCLDTFEIPVGSLDLPFDSSGLDFTIDSCGNGRCDWDCDETHDNCPEDCLESCGNTQCEPEKSEDSCNCSQDCGEHCGNNVCDCGESNSSCPGDCPPECEGEHCGNGICDCGETNISCPVDNCPDGAEPVCDANGPYFVLEGGSVQLDGSNSSDANQPTATLNFEWDLDGDGVFGETGLGADQGHETGLSPVFHAAGIDGPSTAIVLLRVTDDGGLADECAASVQVGNRAPEVEPPSLGSQSVQYSDPIVEVVFTATALAFETMTTSTSWNVNGGAFAAGLPGALSLSGQDCVVDDVDEDDEFAVAFQTCTWVLSGIVGVPEGTYRVVVQIEDDDGGARQVATVINVFPEDADVAFDGDNPVGVQVDAPDGDSPPFSLLVHVNETLPDLSDAQPPAPGNIGFAVVSMTLMPVGPGGPVTTECVPVGVNGSGYDSVLTVSCNFDDVDVNTYIIQATVVGGYYTGYGEDVLVIFDPSLGFTTAGGWFYWPGTEDPAIGYAGDRTNFGYTMKYTKKRKNVRGSLLLIRHLADGTIYRVKSNALQDLAIGKEENPESFGWASFVGKSTYKEPDWPDPIGNYLFITYAEDRGEPGSSDRFWLEIRDKDRDVVPNLSIEFPATANAVTLNGGNIIVPHNPDDQPNNSAQNGPDGVLPGNEQASQTTEPRGGTCGLGMMAFALLAFGLSLLRLRFGFRRS